MAQAYFEEGMSDEDTFSLFVRRLPKRRNYLIACGLDDVLTFLEEFRFDQHALTYLESLRRFSARFLQYLERLRFTGDVYAMEVYTHAPGEFQPPFLSGQRDCGAIVIWTRLYKLK